MRKRVKTRVPSNKTREKYQLSSIWQQQWRDYARNLSQRPPLQRACGSYKNRRLSAPCFTLDPQPMEVQTLQKKIKGSRSKKPIWLAQMFHKDDDRKIISKRLNRYPFLPPPLRPPLRPPLSPPRRPPLLRPPPPPTPKTPKIAMEHATVRGENRIAKSSSLAKKDFTV